MQIRLDFNEHKNTAIPAHFTYLDSFVLPRELKRSRRMLDEHITEETRFKYFLELKNRRDSIKRVCYIKEDFPIERLIYILVWKSPSGERRIFKVGQSQHCWQRIGRNYLSGTGANTGWLSPALHEFLKQKRGEFEIYARGFDDVIAELDKDITVDYTPRLDKIEKHYQVSLDIKDGKDAVAEFFQETGFRYTIK
tara:strand:- start:1002 stop:1586 length:585 start_codon:yes stop_codon:yes gene_type:complete